MQGASHIDVLLACYDALSENLRSAGQAAETGEIEARCSYSQRALLLVGHLQSWVDVLEEEALKDSLLSFYAYLRAEVLRLQLESKAEPYRTLALRICETRAAWQERKSRQSSDFSRAQPTLDDAQSVCRFSCSG